MWSGGFFDHLDLRGKCLYRRRIKGLRSRYFPARRRSDPHPNQARYQLRYTRIFNFCHYTTAGEKIKDFSVCGHLCGQSRFYATFSNREKSHKRRCCKALRRFALTRPGYRHGTPKPGAIPTSLYPDAYGRRFCAAHLLYLTFRPDARWNRNFFPSMPQALRLRRSPPPPGGRP